jgi:hypothetical protein
MAKVKELIRNNPKIKPTEVQSSIILSAFRENLEWDTVAKEARSILNKKNISNIKETMKNEVQPYGHNFEAVVNFKEYCDKKDKFYIYKVNDRRGNPGQPSFVFKTSTEKLKIAVAMDRSSNGFLNEEFCFVDGKHNRCRSFITLTASVYHPLLQKQIPIAIMEAEGEKTENVELFWNLLNEAISKISENTSFNPIGWCTDMSGALISGICNVFGEDCKTRIKSCEFHFKDQRNKRARRLGSNAELFKGLCNSILNATTETAYNSAMETLNAFINADPDRDFLKTWISWWNDRRGFIFRAFAPTNAPRMNQAEVIHAGWAHRDQPKLSLLDVCQADTRDSLLLELELQSLHAGSAIKGKGPSFMDHKRKRYQREIDRAKKMGKEMFDGRKVDPKSTHRPPAEKKTQSQKTKNQVPPKKQSQNGSTTAVVLPPTTSAAVTIPRQTAIPMQKQMQPQIQLRIQPQQLQMQPQIQLHIRPQQLQIQPQIQFQRQPQIHQPQIQPQMQPQRQPHIQQQILPASIGQQQSSQQWHSGMSPNAYEFVLMPLNVKKCYGCGGSFVDKYRTSPHNVIIKHNDKRVIGRDERTGHLIYSSNFSNTYYHPIESHIRQKNPIFTGSYL